MSELVTRSGGKCLQVSYETLACYRIQLCDYSNLKKENANPENKMDAL